MITGENRIVFVIDNFLNLEKQLLKCMEYIPFIESNKKVISPKFIPIILESCSLIESIFKILTDEKTKTNFKKYAKLHEEYLNLNNSISMFLVSPIEFYQPFKDWANKTPKWWNSYNKIKHDRINNYEYATFEIAVLSIVGAHQLISRCRIFTNYLIRAGWFNPNSLSTGELIAARLMEAGVPIGPIPCESKLVVSPLSFNNFVSFKKGDPIYEDCDFSDRVKMIIELPKYYY